MIKDMLPIFSILKRSFLFAFAFLLIPFFGNFFLSHFNWDIYDFVIAFLLLFIFGTVILFLLNLKFKMKFLFVLLAIVLCFLLWAELAVGIFNSPFSGD